MCAKCYTSFIWSFRKRRQQIRCFLSGPTADLPAFSIRKTNVTDVNITTALFGAPMKAALFVGEFLVMVAFFCVINKNACLEKILKIHGKTLNYFMVNLKT